MTKNTLRYAPSHNEFGTSDEAATQMAPGDTSIEQLVSGKWVKMRDLTETDHTLALGQDCEKPAKLALPLKTVTGPLAVDQLPEPFKSYWTARPVDRPWDFYLVDGELYIYDREELTDESAEGLLFHWTNSNCCGVRNFMRAHGVTPNSEVASLVRKNGEYLFVIRQCAGDYETGVVSPLDGAYFTVSS